MSVTDLRVWSISIEHRRALREAIEERRQQLGTDRFSRIPDAQLSVLNASLAAVDDLIEALDDEKKAHAETTRHYAEVRAVMIEDLQDIVQDGVAKPRSQIVAKARHALAAAQEK